MHERNIYKTPPNFADLAKKYDFFAPFLTVDIRGIPRINFKDEAALRALSRALLLKDFGLNVNIPEIALVPTIPLRLNYILWIEDLLGLNYGDTEEIKGLDIGTGATAVYALLGARKNKWKMTGSEVDLGYFKIAQGNVNKNGLSELVSIVPAKSDTIFEEILSQCEDGHYTFTMCNPPFFSSDEETDSVSKGRYSAEDHPLRPPPSAAKTGQKTELISEGGELEFVRKMIKESIKFPQKVRIFTTMIGIKRHQKQLISELKTYGIINYTTTEFIQGKTMRWGLAWSLYPGIQLFPVHPDLIGIFPNFSTLLNFESLMSSYLSELKLQTLRWLPTTSTDPEAQQSLEIIASSNTWSHQRRKRRETERQKNDPHSQESSDSCEPGGPSPTKVKKMSSTGEGRNIEMEYDADAEASSSNASHEQSVLIHFLMDFEREAEGDAKVILRYRGGSSGKDGMNQILQFLKNRFAKDCKDPNSFVYQIVNSSVPK